MGKHQLTDEERRRGGKAVIDLKPPDACPRCGLEMTGRPWHSYLGHLGLHGLADNHFEGDVQAAQKRLRENGMARQDPTPWNGAMPKYKPVTNGGSQLLPAKAGELVPDLGR